MKSIKIKTLSLCSMLLSNFVSPTSFANDFNARWTFDGQESSGGQNVWSSTHHGDFPITGSGSFDPNGRRGASLFSDVMEVSDIVDLDFSEPFSISLWFLRNFIGNETLVTTFDESGTRGLWIGISELDEPKVILKGNGGEISISGLTDLSFGGEWLHLVVTYNGSENADGVQLYLDGSPLNLTVESDNLAGDWTGSGPLKLGAISLMDFPFDGLLDEVQITNSELSQTEVTCLFQLVDDCAAPPPPDDDPVTGPPGFPGFKGPKGPKGIPGAKGDRGDQGEQGARGPQGPQGPQGVPGPAGPRGLKGERGDQGLAGRDGVDGRDGRDGRTGPRGPQGSDGPAGTEKGATGPRGIRGEAGDKGARGLKGPEGVIGNRGATGAKGDRGPNGDKGPDGARGNTGAKGDQGPKGDKGATGQKGATSTVKGDRGPIGPQGPQGDQGVRGDRGPKGPRGPDGFDSVIILPQFHCSQCSK